MKLKASNIVRGYDFSNKRKCLAYMSIKNKLVRPIAYEKRLLHNRCTTVAYSLFPQTSTTNTRIK